MVSFRYNRTRKKLSSFLRNRLKIFEPSFYRTANVNYHQVFSIFQYNRIRQKLWHDFQYNSKGDHMNTNAEQKLRQQNALNYLHVALYELQQCCNDEQYKQFIKGLSIFTRSLEAILSDLEKVKL